MCHLLLTLMTHIILLLSIFTKILDSAYLIDLLWTFYPSISSGKYTVNCIPLWLEGQSSDFNGSAIISPHHLLHSEILCSVTDSLWLP